jgi:hypothetical protein
MSIERRLHCQRRLHLEQQQTGSRHSRLHLEQQQTRGQHSRLHLEQQQTRGQHSRLHLEQQQTRGQHPGIHLEQQQTHGRDPRVFLERLAGATAVPSTARARRFHTLRVASEGGTAAALRAGIHAANCPTTHRKGTLTNK